MRRTLLLVLPFHLAALFEIPSTGAAAAEEAFVDVTRERGIDFVNVNGASGKKYLIETMLGGAAWIDFDGDGFLDLFLVQGTRHPERALDGGGAEEEPGDVLYRNLGGKRFEEVTRRAGIVEHDYGMGAAVGDYDGDGWPDLYVTNYGKNRLWRNRGDGAFEDATERAGVAAGGFSTSATWADFDGDGRLDLFVVRYLLYDVRRHGGCEGRVESTGETVPAYCHPHRFEGAPDVIYRNQGDGTFRDLSRESGIAASRGWLQGKGLGVVAFDFDGDGDVDLLVANDSVPNSLWRNLGGFRFEDVGLETGFALGAEGQPRAGMGIDRGDVDGDGLLDVHVTNFSRETDTLFLNQGGFFADATIERGLARDTYLPLAFGTRFLDYDLDGDLDLYVASGHILDNAELFNPGQGITYGQRDLLFENDGKGFFRNVSASSGAWFQRALPSRAAAEADYDNDGDPDLLVTSVAGPAVLLENRTGNGKRWVGLDLRADPGAGAVYGAKIELTAGGKRQAREIEADGSYLASHDPRARFGLGAAAGPCSAKILWPGRKEPQLLESLEPGKYHVVRRPR